MARDGMVGVKNLHLAKITNEDTLTYDTPVHIPGTVQIQATRSINESPAYADDETWINDRADQGGEGTISVRDIFTDETIRELIADLTGYMITTEGDVLALSDHPSKPCAVMVEQTAYSGHGRRKLFYWCELGKPSFDAQTKEDSTTVGQLDLPFTFKPVTLGTKTDGTEVRATTRDSFYGNSTYAKFFESVVKTIAEKTA